MQRLLVIRGGAIGDFILTLPAIGALRKAFPEAHIEVVGNLRRTSLARHSQYADQITDVEDLELYRLFSRQANISDQLSAYLGSFDAIIAYLPHIDDVFVTNVRRICPGYVVTWPPHPSAGQHATDHLLRPVGDFLQLQANPEPRVYLSDDALDAAGKFWQQAQLPVTGVVALHPGSGGMYKVWPLPGWQRVMRWVADQGLPCILLCGPAERDQVRWLMRETALPDWPCVGEMSLLHLAAIMARCQLLVGHDSGMTHLAAAVGCTTLALFGPTDPLTWGPRYRRACVLRPQEAGPLTLDNLPPEIVIQTLEALYLDAFAFAPSSIGCTISVVPTSIN